LVHNVLPHIIVDSFNNLEGQYWKETVIHYVMALGMFKPLPFWIHVARCYGIRISEFFLEHQMIPAWLANNCTVYLQPLKCFKEQEFWKQWHKPLIKPCLNEKKLVFTLVHLH
jgi:hypothetical protein